MIFPATCLVHKFWLILVKTKTPKSKIPGAFSPTFLFGEDLQFFLIIITFAEANWKMFFLNHKYVCYSLWLVLFQYWHFFLILFTNLFFWLNYLSDHIFLNLLITIIFILNSMSDTLKTWFICGYVFYFLYFIFRSWFLGSLVIFD